MAQSMFILHTAVALEVLAAVAAGFLLVWSNGKTGAASRAGKTVASLGLLLAATSFLCTGYYGFAYWQEGLYSPKSVAAAGNGMGGTMGMRSMMQGMHVCSKAGETFEHCMEKVPQAGSMPAH